MDPRPIARIALLDGFSLQVGGSGHLAKVGLPPGVQRLVAHVGLARDRARTVVAGQLWPDVPEVHAARSLHSALSRVQAVAPGLVHVSRDTVSLAPGVQVDVHDVVTWAQRVCDPRLPIEDVPLTDVRLRGDLLPGWSDDWVLLDRERLRQLRMHALETLADRLSAAQRHGEAVQAACAAVHAEPLRESAHRALIRVHLAQGDPARGVRAYDAFRRRIAHELGVAPTRQMTDLVRRIPRQRGAQERWPSPGGAGAATTPLTGGLDEPARL